MRYIIEMMCLASMVAVVLAQSYVSNPQQSREQYLTDVAIKMSAMKEPTPGLVADSLDDPEVFALVLLRFPETTKIEIVEGTPLAVTLGDTLFGHLYNKVTGESREVNLLQLSRLFVMAGGDLKAMQEKVDPIRGSGPGWTLEKTIRGHAPELLPEFTKLLKMSQKL